MAKKIAVQTEVRNCLSLTIRSPRLITADVHCRMDNPVAGTLENRGMNPANSVGCVNTASRNAV